MQVTLNKSQYGALNPLRLDGSTADFDELVDFIGVEMADWMLSDTAARALASLAVKIDPSCSGRLGS